MDHRSRAVLNQTQVDAKTNEITGLQPLLEDLDLTGQIITADAMHTQREHADWLVTEQHAAYLLVVKANQPGLYHQLASLPRRAIPLADHTRDRGHGRAEVRRLQVTTIAGLDFPHGTQALRITRRVRSLPSRRWRTVTVYAVTNLTAGQASPARLADYVRGHWASRRCTTSATPPSPRTPPSSAAATRPGPWPAYATSPLPSSGGMVTTTSPPRCAATPATPPESCHCLALQAHEPVIPTLCRRPGVGAYEEDGQHQERNEEHPSNPHSRTLEAKCSP
jgi:Transposase DDE domain